MSGATNQWAVVERMADTSLRTLIGHNVADAVGKAGVSSVWLAERVGVGEKHIRDVLNGSAGMSIELADRIMNVLGREWLITYVAKGHP